MKNKSWLVLVAMVMGAGAQAASDTLLDCWDGSFNYGEVTIKELRQDSHLFEIVMKSADPAFLHSVIPGKLFQWGPGAEVRFNLLKTDCKTSAGDDLLVKCETKRQSHLTISYLKSQGDKRTLELTVENFQLRTSHREVTDIDGSSQRFGATIEFETKDKAVRQQRFGAYIDMQFPGECRTHPH